MNSIVVRGERRSQEPRRTGVQPPEAVEFVRFCYRRRRAHWPEIYDEMCAVACRGDFKGWGFEELSEHGIRFTIDQLPDLSALVEKVVREDEEAGQEDDAEGEPAPPRPARDAVGTQRPRFVHGYGRGGAGATSPGWPVGRIRARAG